MLPIITQWVNSSGNSLFEANIIELGLIKYYFTNYGPLIYSSSIAPTSNIAFGGQPAYQNNLSLISNVAGVGVPNIVLGTTGPIAPSMPKGQARQLAFANIGLAGGDTVLTVNGYYENIFITEEVIVGGDLTAASLNYYTSLQSITINTNTTNAGNSLQIGITDAGYTTFPILDVYNKNSLYTLSYTNVIDGSVVFEPIFITQPVVTFPNGQPVYASPDIANYFPLNVDNPNVIISSTNPINALPATLAINEVAAFSISGIPLTSLATSVTSSSAFTQTIIQQGARF
jgi:hypothetical protein